MRRSWWKILSVLILVYAFVAGMLTPLKPNLVSVSPAVVEAGQLASLDVVGYNTRFTAGEQTAWLRAGDELGLRAESVEVIDDRRARLHFSLPASMPAAGQSKRLSLVVNSTEDGAFVAPDVVTLNRGGIDDNNAEAWSVSALRKGDISENPATTFPYRGLLAETIRNTYFHVSLWFAMMILFIIAVVYAVKYLRRQAAAARGDVLDVATVGLGGRELADYWSRAFTGVGMLFGILGLLTGAVWAKYTWGSFWSWDIKQFTTLIALLIYAGYFVLRASFRDPEQQARLGAVYNIFAFICLIPLIYVLPRLSGNSLHPGAAGNPAMGGEDLDNTMRMVFYPTIIGWTLFGTWMATLAFRLRRAAATRWGVQ